MEYSDQKFVSLSKFRSESSWWKFWFLISRVSNKPNTRITRVVLVRKYSALQEQSCGSSLSCPWSAEHIENYPQDFRTKPNFCISIEQDLNFCTRLPTPPPPHTISAKIKLMMFHDTKIKLCLWTKPPDFANSVLYNIYILSAEFWLSIEGTSHLTLKGNVKLIR